MLKELVVFAHGESERLPILACGKVVAPQVRNLMGSWLLLEAVEAMARKYDSLINKSFSNAYRMGVLPLTSTLESRHLRSEAQACFEKA